MEAKELVLKAIEARKLSYSPYSNFAVGAALLTKDGHILSKAKGWKPMTLTERTGLIKVNDELVLWNDYEFTGTIDSVSTKISLRILVHRIASCIKNNKSVELNRVDVSSMFYQK